MFYTLSGRCGFDANAIAERLALLDLHEPGSEQASVALQQKVIRPNIDTIVTQFCESLERIEQFNTIVGRHSDPERMRKTQEQYLLSLGVGFGRREYFEERLRIGCVHQKIGVPQSIYQCSFQQLQHLLIEAIPSSIRDDEAAFEQILQFILKITALDMSLANESYFKSRVVKLQQSLQSERGETERLRKLSITDWLTDLHNHSYSRRCLSVALDRARRERTPLSVIMADLDHFKDINDTHGHLIGDEVLRLVAARMQSGARSVDLVGRYGGEEFLFILQDTDMAGAEHVAERVRARISCDAMQCGDVRLQVTMSLGAAEARYGDTVDELIERADEALYAAKAAGRNCVRLHTG